MGPYLWSDLPSSSRSDEAIKTDGSTRSQGRKAQGGGAFTDEGPHAGNLTFFVPKTNGWNLNIIPLKRENHLPGRIKKPLESMTILVLRVPLEVQNASVNVNES